MSYIACIQDQPDYIRVTLSGSFDSQEELFDFAALLVRMGEEYSKTRALVDRRRLNDKTDLMDVYRLSESDLTVRSAMKGVRIACLAADHNLEHLRSFETVMPNRSLIYRVFTDEDEAVDWLTA